MLLEDDPRVYAFTRRLDDTELLVVANVSGEPASAAGIPDAERWAGAELLITNVQERGQSAFLAARPVGGAGLPARQRTSFRLRIRQIPIASGSTHPERGVVVATCAHSVGAEHLVDHRVRTCASCPARRAAPSRNESEPTIAQPIGSTK